MYIHCVTITTTDQLFAPSNAVHVREVSGSKRVNKLINAWAMEFDLSVVCVTEVDKGKNIVAAPLRLQR